jgi:D-arginine dehydrogenase
MIGRSDQLTKLKRAHDEWVKLVPSVRWLEGDEVRDVTPMLKRDYVAGGVLEPAANDLDVHEIHRGFLRGAARAGATLVCDAEVLELSRQRAAWRVRTKTGEFRGDFIINAAGAWGDTVAALAGARPVGLAPKRRTAILFDPAPSEDVNSWPTIIDADEQFYFKPDAGRVLGSPADETVSPPCDAQPEEIDVALAVDRIEQAATFRVQRLVRKWAGLRNFVADKSPVVGLDRGVPGFFWLVAQGGYGIQTSPALARVVAALIRGGDVPEDLQSLGVRADDLSPARLK